MTQCILKKQLAWVVDYGKVGASTDILYGPVSPICHALVDANGFPYKGSRTPQLHVSKLATKCFLWSSSLPQGWIPDVAILEGMFIIQTPQCSYYDLRTCRILFSFSLPSLSSLSLQLESQRSMCLLTIQEHFPKHLKRQNNQDKSKNIKC